MKVQEVKEMNQMDAVAKDTENVKWHKMTFAGFKSFHQDVGVRQIEWVRK